MGLQHPSSPVQAVPQHHVKICLLCNILGHKLCKLFLLARVFEYHFANGTKGVPQHLEACLPPDAMTFVQKRVTPVCNVYVKQQNGCVLQNTAIVTYSCLGKQLMEF